MSGTHARQSTGTLEFHLTYEITREKVLLNSISCGVFSEKAYDLLRFEPNTIKAGNGYTITASSPDSTGNNAVSL